MRPVSRYAYSFIRKSGGLLRSCVIAVVWLEFFSFIAYYMYAGEWFAYHDVQKKIAIQAKAVSTSILTGDQYSYLLKRRKGNIPNANIHPYLGFGPPSALEELDHPVKKPGPLAANTLVIGLTGGSNTAIIYDDENAMRTLENRLREVPAFQKKNIKFINLSRVGYKQPQQIISLLLFLLHNGDIDVLINLDGHNEIIEAFNNTLAGVHYSYPALWDQLIGVRFVGLEVIKSLSQVVWMQELRQDVARSMQNSYLSHSITALLCWSAIDDILKSKIHEKYKIFLDVLKKHNKNKIVYGPSQKKQGAMEKSLLLADLWAKGSIMVNRISQQYGIDYFHFLQPIPQWPGNKTLTNAERKLGINSFQLKKYKINMYKAELRKSERFKEEGIVFYSLLDVFKPHKETIWVDWISHVNPLGNQILVDAMADRIVAYYKEHPEKAAAHNKQAPMPE